MPPLSAYTPFESLLFFQTLAASKEPPANFTSISKSLNENPLVRQNVAFSAERLSPEALEDLYATLLRDGFDREACPTGAYGRSPDNHGSNNLKKRKISSPRPEGTMDGLSQATLIPDLVARLYARYKELATQEIRDEEKRYNEIKGEIEQLQKESAQQATAAWRETEVPPTSPKIERKQSLDVNVKLEPPRQEPPQQKIPIAGQAESRQPLPAAIPAAPSRSQELAHPPSAPSPPVAVPEIQQTRQQTQTTTAPTSQDVTVQSSKVHDVSAHPHQQPIAPRAQLPDPSTPVATRVVPSHPSQVAPRPHGPIITPSASVKPNLPLSTSQHPTPTQSSFQQWQLEASPHSPYSAVSPATAAPATVPAVTKPPSVPLLGAVRAPSRVSHSSTIPSTPGTSTPLVHTPAHGGLSHGSQTPSVVIPAYAERKDSRPRLSIDTPGSCTPWKRTPRFSIPESPASPPRPRPEDVSPISERAPSPDAMQISPPREKKATRRSQAATAVELQATPSIKIENLSSTRRNRAISSASTQSRGRSVASRDVSRERARSVTRRKEPATVTDDQTPKARPKRKRGASESLENESVVFEQPRIDTTKYVLCTRGFHRTAAPIMNDVTTHKLASIFAKPISERDAPGYHDLIYRPQDLKSIKSAVHQGSKSVAAATEAVSTPAGDGESPAPGVGTPSKNNVLMLQKTEDLVPPKAIVNSAQLEKELIRMFANAIMYNPIPARGFGPAFPMMNERGSRESTQSGEGDEGGIIQDSLEMFEDVEQAVTHWRQAERTAERNADDMTNKNILFLRRGSVSDFNTDSADDLKG
ncbi:hypothetical protein N7539_005941 [Penicillium diatomitis]|uniref:Bromo domain-containing protein n=1 Tax=Penicillium diatomitis TaxID=2819901 RepID=A0A9W9X5Q9_9EURO|nr:uncharacterized protein N7539_005941 [Penicillium diatomitis]KAJ5484145.1 hypothetical protein N7539_005941 [Penicillium diatomitis]